MPAPLVITLSAEERKELEARTRARTGEQRTVERARIVLLAAEGVSNKDIAEKLPIDADTVCKWRKRFAQERLARLGDRPRPGRPATYGHDDRLKVIKTVTETPPEPASHWSGQQIADALAAEVGISRSQIWRILDDLDLKPHRVQSCQARSCTRPRAATAPRSSPSGLQPDGQALQMDLRRQAPKSRLR